MVFTPLLASTTVGTLECRSVAINLLDLKPALRHPQHHYFAASARKIDVEAKTIHCEAADGHKFQVAFDQLVVATGSQVNYSLELPELLVHQLLASCALNGI